MAKYLKSSSRGVKKFKKQLYMICQCGQTLLYSGIKDQSGKKHAHCRKCRLEWHLDKEGHWYNHKMQQKVEPHRSEGKR